MKKQEGRLTILLVLAVSFVMEGVSWLQAVRQTREHASAPELVRAIADHLRGAAEVEHLVDLVTITVGTDQVLICARLDFDDSLGAADVERTCVRLTRTARGAQGGLRGLPGTVSRGDPRLWDRVIERYGHSLSE